MLSKVFVKCVPVGLHGGFWAVDPREKGGGELRRGLEKVPFHFWKHIWSRMAAR